MVSAVDVVDVVGVRKIGARVGVAARFAEQEFQPPLNGTDERAGRGTPHGNDF